MSVQKALQVVQTIDTQLAPAIQSVKKGIENYLPKCNEQTWVFLESTSLIQLTGVTFRNLPYVLLANGFGINDFFHFISSRTNYLEVIWISAASTAYNIFLTVFYTGMFAITLGLNKHISYCCKKHWMHIAYCISALGIGTVGFFSPFVATVLTIRLFHRYYLVLKSNYKNDLVNFEDPLVKAIKDAFLQNRNRLITWTHDQLPDRFDKEFYPSLLDIEQRIKYAKKMDDIVALIIRIWYEFPRMQPKDSSLKSEEINLNNKETPKLAPKSPAPKDHYPPIK